MCINIKAERSRVFKQTEYRNVIVYAYLHLYKHPTSGRSARGGSGLFRLISYLIPQIKQINT